MPEMCCELQKVAAIRKGIDNNSEENKMKVMIAVNPSNFDQENTQRASYSSENAFNWALNTIKSTNTKTHFKLLLIHVKPPKSCIDHLVNLCLSCAGNWSSADTERSREAMTHLLRFTGFEGTFNKICEEDEIAYEWVRRTGRNPEKVICNEVKELQPNVLVLGNRGLTYFQRLFRANVSEYCAKNAACDVIRIKHTPESPSPYDD